MVEFTPIEVSAWIKKLGPSKSMVLEGLPTRVMIMVVVVETLRQLLASIQGNDVTGDSTNR